LFIIRYSFLVVALPRCGQVSYFKKVVADLGWRLIGLETFTSPPVTFVETRDEK
jgi:hypothetical protein